VSRRLVILDRDGVINRDSDEFVKSPAEWIPLDGSIEAIAMLSGAGFDVAVATNQSGIGRGLLDRPALVAIHDKMRRSVSEAGGDIGKIVFCPHRPDDDCDCRKPKPGLLLELSRQYGVPLINVPVVGDSARDIDAARAVGARPILVLTGNGESAAATLDAEGAAVETFNDLLSVAKRLVEENRGA
jgi:D-glycero-D-manno-heptose 1,7-bisphosphate phosphatase